MSKFEIVLYPDTRLRKRSTEISKEDLTKDFKDTVEQMWPVMYELDGLGLAAPQVGWNVRLFLMDLGGESFVMINPKMVKGRSKEIGLEGCLSLPGVQGNIARFNHAVVGYMDLDGVDQQLVVQGIGARCVQHEIDHLDGKLMLDYFTSEDFAKNKAALDRLSLGDSL